tara:strand:+ start:3971 stop:4240 length:270 start_codon:yes stop_codon:yes gene_type:complete
MSKCIKTKFVDLAEEVLAEADEALSVDVIIDKVAAKALTKKLKSGRKPSNRYLQQMSNRTVNHLFKVDKRFAKFAQDEWRVNLWTLSEE